MQEILQGILLKSHGGFYFVRAAGKTYVCSPRGRLKQELRDTPLGLIVGDRLKIAPQNEHLGGMEGTFNGAPDSLPKATIEALCERDNYMIRPKIANVDQCLIVLAAKHPKPDFLLLDRMLVALFAAGIRPVIVLNKIDQPGTDKLLDELAPYREADVPVYPISALAGNGMAPLLERLRGQVSTVAGQSGVGKSTLLNLLLGLHHTGDALQTGEISRKLQRGRHTTRTVELLPLDADEFGATNIESWVADTPGFSRLALPEQMAEAELAGYYPDLVKLAAGCRFDGCRHHNEPDCAVKAAVADGRLAAERYQRYLVLLDEVTANTTY